MREEVTISIVEQVIARAASSQFDDGRHGKGSQPGAPVVNAALA